MFFRKALSTRLTQKANERKIYENSGYAEDALAFELIDAEFKKSKRISKRLPDKIFKDQNEEVLFSN